VEKIGKGFNFQFFIFCTDQNIINYFFFSVRGWPNFGKQIDQILPKAFMDSDKYIT